MAVHIGTCHIFSFGLTCAEPCPSSTSPEQVKYNSCRISRLINHDSFILKIVLCPSTSSTNPKLQIQYLVHRVCRFPRWLLLSMPFFSPCATLLNQLRFTKRSCCLWASHMYSTTRERTLLSTIRGCTGSAETGVFSSGSGRARRAAPMLALRPRARQRSTPVMKQRSVTEQHRTILWAAPREPGLG